MTSFGFVLQIFPEASPPYRVALWQWLNWGYFLTPINRVFVPSQDSSDHQDDITFLVGNPYKPFFATVTGKGPHPTYNWVFVHGVVIKHPTHILPPKTPPNFAPNVSVEPPGNDRSRLWGIFLWEKSKALFWGAEASLKFNMVHLQNNAIQLDFPTFLWKRDLFSSEPC